MKKSAVVLVPLLFMSTGAAFAQDVPQVTEHVDVIAVTPLEGLGVARDRVPANVQTLDDAGVAWAPGIDIGEQLGAGAASVHRNEAQGNPFQADVQLRGFVASPLLGLPQGLAVYQDGVRLNEPFGDTVNWDLLPANAVAAIEVTPGSSALFGLNALGGAVALKTKTGFTHPGHGAGIFAGSFRRRWIDLQSAARRDRIGYFTAGRLLDEDGWRDFSPTRLRQLFASVEWRRDGTSIGVSATGGRNRLVGNGAAPVELLDEERTAVFTHPDETKTAMALIGLRGRRALPSGVLLDGVAFYRPAAVRTFNGDDNPLEDDEVFTATNNTSRTSTRGWGGTLQATIVRPLRARDNHFVAGASLDHARSRYAAATEMAWLTDTRGTVGSGVFDEEAFVGVHTRARHAALFAADFFTPTPRLTVMAAARVNHSVVELRDQLGDDLDGDHRFSRVNPTAGLTFAVSPALTAFGSLSYSSRVPAPSELSCADPEDPCRLPNAFVADPPLRQVVARTWEGGLRGRRWASWSAVLFRTISADDIVFISSGRLTNQGHFANVGDTRRQGVELAAAAMLRAVRWSARYTWLTATFRTPLTLSSPNHPDEDDGEIDVARGSSVPGVPRHNLSAGLGWTMGALTAGAAVQAASSQHLRGDEANLMAPVDGFVTAGLHAAYAVHRRVRVVGRVTNLFDSRHATFGVLGEADDVLGDAYEDPRFISPAAPRAAWLGIELR